MDSFEFSIDSCGPHKGSPVAPPSTWTCAFSGSQTVGDERFLSISIRERGGPFSRVWVVRLSFILCDSMIVCYYELYMNIYGFFVVRMFNGCVLLKKISFIIFFFNILIRII